MLPCYCHETLFQNIPSLLGSFHTMDSRIYGIAQSLLNKPESTCISLYIFLIIFLLSFYLCFTIIFLLWWVIFHNFPQILRNKKSLILTIPIIKVLSFKYWDLIRSIRKYESSNLIWCHLLDSENKIEIRIKNLTLDTIIYWEILAITSENVKRNIKLLKNLGCKVLLHLQRYEECIHYVDEFLSWLKWFELHRYLYIRLNINLA